MDEDASALFPTQGKVVPLDDEFEGIPKGSPLFDLQDLPTQETHFQEAATDGSLGLDIGDSGRFTWFKPTEGDRATHYSFQAKCSKLR